jgi:periplasmic protein TonB
MQYFQQKILQEIPLDIENFVVPKPKPLQQIPPPSVAKEMSKGVKKDDFVSSQPKFEQPAIEQTKPEPDTLSRFAYTNRSQTKTKKEGESIKDDLRLYDFERYTPSQQEFVRDNLTTIKYITQKNLQYPMVAQQMNLSGMNVVEFELLPSGDIQNLKLLKSSGEESLDENTRKTIEVSFKDYPRPSEKTTIRFYVYYRIY